MMIDMHCCTTLLEIFSFFELNVFVLSDSIKRLLLTNNIIISLSVMTFDTLNSFEEYFTPIDPLEAICYDYTIITVNKYTVFKRISSNFILLTVVQVYNLPCRSKQLLYQL